MDVWKTLAHRGYREPADLPNDLHSGTRIRYYVMELLEGLDADTLVKRFGPMPAERIVWVVRQICHFLSEAQSVRARASRHQAGEYLPVPVRRGLRLSSRASILESPRP